MSESLQSKYFGETLERKGKEPRTSRRSKRDGDDVGPARANIGALSQGSETSVLAVRGDEFSASRWQILSSRLERGQTDAQLGRLSQGLGLGSWHPADGLLPAATFFDIIPSVWAASWLYSRRAFAGTCLHVPSHCWVHCDRGRSHCRQSPLLQMVVVRY